MAQAPHAPPYASSMCIMNSRLLYCSTQRVLPMWDVMWAEESSCASAWRCVATLALMDDD